MTNDRFREALRLHLTDDNQKPLFKTMKELKVLMKLKEFRMVWNKELKTTVPAEPTQKQLDYAYKYVKGYSQIPITDYLEKSFVTIRGRTYTRYRDRVTGRFESRRKK